MIAINKGTIIAAVIGYGLYRFFSTGDVTVIPPTQSDVRDVLNASNPALKLTRESIRLPTGCNRTGGGILKQGVYSCKVELTGKAADLMDTQTFKLTKSDGQWRLTN